jgi:hypothetical protein
MPACTSIANHKGTNLAALGSPASPDRAMPNQNSHSPDISREFGGQEDVGYSPPTPPIVNDIEWRDGPLKE